MTDGNHWLALQYVYKRHIVQGQALEYTALRERTYIMMNDEKVIIRRRSRFFELYWPRGNRVARVIEGGQIAGINGYMHMIDNVLIYEPDLRAQAPPFYSRWELLLGVATAALFYDSIRRVLIFTLGFS
uniref:FAS1 domain-containing protein n=1 Tax=Steinernema glaseri TaxID=37863 RepID=A0A1I7ZLU1_9BILA